MGLLEGLGVEGDGKLARRFFCYSRELGGGWRSLRRRIFFQYLPTQASQLLPAAVSRPPKASAAISASEILIGALESLGHRQSLHRSVRGAGLLRVGEGLPPAKSSDLDLGKVTNFTVRRIQWELTAERPLPNGPRRVATGSLPL